MNVKGIDVSQHQTNIDFDKVKKVGYSYVIIRAGFGRYINQKDPYFEQNYTRAKKAGLNVGVYWYSYATSEADAANEAAVCLEVIKGKKFEYPIYFDLEDQSQFSRGKAFCSALVAAFCSELEKAGYFAGLYISRSPLQQYITAEVASRYALWIAEYGSKCNYNGTYGMWQYSSEGKVSGISGNVDMDVCYVDYPKIIKEKGLNGYSKTDSKAKDKTDTVVPFDKYFAERIGKGLDWDGYYSVQCADLANDYAVNLIGSKPFIGGSAYEFYTNFANQPSKNLYERIPNTPDFVPIKGDIMVWGQSLGKHGHVAICNGEGDTTWFESYEQNWGGKNEPVELIKHNYNHVLGVLRPKDQTKIWGKSNEVNKSIKGDINGDGKVNVADVALLAAHVKGIKKIE